MRPARLAAAVLTLLAVSTACRARTQVTADPTPSPRVPSVELIGQNLSLFPGADRATRIGFAPADPSARVIVSFRSGAGRTVLCPLTTIGAPLPPASACFDASSGVRETVRAEGLVLGGLAILYEGDAEQAVDLVLEYAERSRSLTITMPRIRVPAGASACKDNGCNPFFEVRPARNGSFTATARWNGGDGIFSLLQGRVIARSFSATGLPYETVDRRDGAPPLRLSARLRAPAEYALALENVGGEGAVDMTDVVIEANWP